MINIRTGEELQEPSHSLTRRDALKGGMAAILATGVAPWLAGSANGGVARGMMRNVGARNAAMFGGGGWKNPYVTDGLTNCLHGLWNGGWNISNGSDATEWIDCVSGTVKPINKGANSYFGSNFWHREAALGAFVTDIPYVREDTTIEVVARADAEGTFIGNDLTRRAEIAILYGGFQFYAKNQSGTDTYIISYTGITLVYPLLISVALRMYADGSCSYYFPNLNKRTTGSGVGYSYLQNSFANIGAWYSTNNAMTGDFYCIRRYDRILEDSEIDENWKADKMVFNLP